MSHQMPKLIGKLAEIRIIQSKRGVMTIDLHAVAERVIECYKNRSGGSFNMVLGTKKEIEEGIRRQLQHDLAYHKFLEGYLEFLEGYLEFRFNVNEIENGMACESFSIGTMTWYPVVPE